MSALDRRALRAALAEAEPWLLADDVGPRAVDAGPCDRCGGPPRILPTCGPSAFEALCRDCALTLGLDAWCDGHREEGRAALRWAVGLPAAWDVAVALWWVATGELELDALVWRRARMLPPAVAAALPVTPPAPGPPAG